MVYPLTEESKMKSYRVEFRVTAFVKNCEQISPHRIEERMIAMLRDVVVGDTETVPLADDVFGIIQNLSVVQND